MNIIDPMFPTIANPRDKDVLIGVRPSRMVKALERIFDLSLQNPLVTYISGDVGAGKSHVINHIQYLSERDGTRQMVIINANQFSSIRELAILRSIHGNLKDIGVVSSPTSQINMDQLVREINSGLEKLSEASTNPNKYGLIIAIDGLDEFVRDKSLDTAQLLITVRLLLENLDKATFVLSLTHSVLDEAKRKYLAEDRTFSRRFIGPQEYDGTPLNFKGFSFSETLELYHVYRNRWLHRRLERGEITKEGYDELKNSDWPISEDAISLAYRATNKTPRALQFLLQHALNNLRERYPDEWLNPRNIVYPEQMAQIIDIAERRAVSGMSISDAQFKHKIQILKAPNNYFDAQIDVAQKHKSSIVEVIRDIIKDTGFDTGRLLQPDYEDSYILEVRTSEDKNYSAIGFLIILGRKMTKEDIEFLYSLTSGGKLGHNVEYVLVINDNGNEYRYGIYGDFKPIDFIQKYGRHLGNYTYLLRLTNKQLRYIYATYAQRGKEYYKALLEITDKHIGINRYLPLSKVISDITYAALERSEGH